MLVTSSILNANKRRQQSSCAQKHTSSNCAASCLRSDSRAATLSLRPLRIICILRTLGWCWNVPATS